MIDLPEAQLREVNAILMRHAYGHAAFAFGSRVTGKAKPYSDLDVALAGPLPPGMLAALRDAFEESELPIRVDIIDLSAISPAFHEAIRPQLTLL